MPFRRRARVRVAASLMGAVLFLMARDGVAKQAVASAATQTVPLEYEVRAAFLLNFTKFIDWPHAEGEAPDSPFTLCVAGDDPFGPVLDQTVRGEKHAAHPLQVQRLGHTPPAPKTCRIVYVSRSESNVKELLSGLGPGVLTVGEGDTFLRAGGMIAFVLDNRRVRFNINLGATRTAMLTVSSRLLAIARSVGR